MAKMLVNTSQKRKPCESRNCTMALAIQLMVKVDHYAAIYTANAATSVSGNEAILQSSQRLHQDGLETPQWIPHRH